VHFSKAMERSTAFMLVAATLYLLSLIRVSPAFVPTVSRPQYTFRGATGALDPAALEKPSTSTLWGPCLQGVAAAVAVAGAASAVSKNKSKPRAQARVQMQVARSPIEIYSTSLMEASRKKEETVQVVKDAMSIKRLYADGDWIETKLSEVANAHWLTDIEVADELNKLFSPLESEVMPKFVTYLAKKRRLNILKDVILFTVKGTYEAKNIVPVVVRSATKLSDDKVETIKAKMKERTGAADIKLVTRIQPDLLAGFVIELGFVDPDSLDNPTEEIDCSLKNFLKNAAIDQGVDAMEV